MAELWLNQLREASFKGVPFRVEDTNNDFGRRTTDHEFPGQDQPVIEDLGRKKRSYTINGYLVAGDYTIERDRLQEVCEQPGPGELIHPYKGSRQVICKGFTVRESQKEGRMARISLSFVEIGDEVFPRESINTPLATKLAFDDSLASLKSDFISKMNLLQTPQFIIDKALDVLNQSLAFIEDKKLAGKKALSFQTQLLRIKSRLDELIRVTSDLADSIADLLGVEDDNLTAIDRLNESLSVSDFEPTQDPPDSNQQAISDFTTQAAVLTAAESSADAEFISAESAEETLTEIENKIDEIMLTASDDLYDKLHILRSAVVRDLKSRFINLPRIIEINLPESRPSIALAFDLYEDTKRSDEIEDRNKVFHPGFVPGGVALEVLTRE